MKKAERTYLIQFIVAMLLYVITLIASIFAVRLWPSSPLRYVIGLLPILPVVYWMFAFLRFFDHLDELQKEIQLRAMAFALAGIAILTFSYGLLQKPWELPDFPVVWILPISVFLWGIGAALAGRKYQ